MKATWNNTVIAESNDTVVVEGNHYFPPESVNKEYFQESNSHTTCPWKGEASYYNVVVNGETNKDAAWYYPEPKEAAAEIKDRVAFWRGVKSGQNRGRGKRETSDPPVPFPLPVPLSPIFRLPAGTSLASELRITQHHVLSHLWFRRKTD